MTSPTKALLPYMLEDFRKVIIENISKSDKSKDSNKIDDENSDKETPNNNNINSNINMSKIDKS